MSKHTPGPWRFRPMTTGSKTRWRDIVADYQGKPRSALVIGVNVQGRCDDFWISCSPEDAALIARAPDMHAAIEKMATAWSEWMDLPYNGTTEDLLNAVGEVMDSAGIEMLDDE